MKLSAEVSGASRRRVFPGAWVVGLLLLASCAGDARPLHGLLVVTANRLTLADALSDKQMARITRRSSVALVSPLCAGPRVPAAVLASAAAGSPSRGDADYPLVLNRDEPFEAGTAGEAFLRRTGMPPYAEGLVHVGIVGSVRANDRLLNPPSLWTTGQSLLQQGIPRAAFANSDRAHPGGKGTGGIECSRAGGALLIDESGRVPAGDVGGGTVIYDREVPGGLRTDLEGLFDRVCSALYSGAVVSVEFGDLERIEAERSSCTPRAYEHARRVAVERLGNWLARIRAAAPDAPVIVSALVPPLSDEGEWSRLGLIVAAGGGFDRGLLVSSTTRTPGIVASIDLSPTVLGSMEVQAPPSVTGYGAYTATGNRSPGELAWWEDIISLNHELQFPLLLALGSLASIAGLSAIWYLARAKKAGIWSRLSIVLLALSSWIPPVLLVPLTAPAFYLLLAPALALGFFLAVRQKDQDRFLPLEIPVYVMLAVILLSVGGVLNCLKTSVLSSWQLSGLRFYGIGNEYMGCVIGSISALVVWRWGRSSISPPTTRLSLWFAFWILVLGLPILGANAGGAVAATVTFALILRALLNKPVRFRDAALATAAGVAVAAALVGLDTLLGGRTPSHFGLAAKGAGTSWAYVLALVQRKAQLSLTVWNEIPTLLTLALFAVVAGMWLRYRETMLRSLDLPARMAQGIIAIGYGGLVAFAVNDSGIVSLAFMAGYVILWWMWDAVTHRAGGVPRMAVRNARSRG